MASRWLACFSNETGWNEVYVRPFPGPGGKWQVSTGGGATPTWPPTRSEFFYSTPDNRIMVASYTDQSGGFTTSSHARTNRSTASRSV